MQFPTFALGLLLAATTTFAAPTSTLDAIPVGIFSGEVCKADKGVTTAYIPTDGSCFQPSPIYSGNTNSFRLAPEYLPKLPKGCTVEVFRDYTCSSTGDDKKVLNKIGECKSWGPNKPIGSARTVGTCK